MTESNNEPPGAKVPDFLISRSLYTDVLQPDISEVIQPSNCIVFSVSLPFQFPVPNKTCFGVAYSNIASAHIFEKFETSTDEAWFPGSTLKLGQMRTRVEMVAFFAENEELPKMESIYDLSDDAGSFLYSHFCHLLNRLNHYIYAYRLLFEDSKTHSLSPEQFSQVYMAKMDVPSFDIKFSGPFVVSANPFNYEQITFNVPERYMPAISTIGRILNQSTSSISSAYMSFADARRFLYRGDTKEAVIHLGIASEALLNGVYRHIRLVAGSNDTEINNEIESTGLTSRINRTISHHLGARWNLKEESKSVPGKWKRTVYDLRNRVVHGGYQPTLEEAWRGFSTFVDFVAFIRKRLKRKRRKIPVAFEEISNFPPLFIRGKEITTFDLS